jgi:hypothetical protein
MARHPISNKHGKPTEYFWSDKHAVDPERAIVFRQTEAGIKKVTGVHYDSKNGKIVKQS